MCDPREGFSRDKTPMKLLTMGISMVFIGTKKSLLPVVQVTFGEACCVIYMVNYSEEVS